MSRWLFLLTRTAVFLATISAIRTAGADLIKLKSGGEIRGEIDRKIGTVTAEQVEIQTLTGATVEVDRSQIEFVTRRPVAVEEFEVRLKTTPDTVEALWELGEWCLENRLSRQREIPLERILELDPEHAEAHRALGHIQHEGQWMTRDELMASRGYVKYKGRYVTSQELELLEKTSVELAAEREWHDRVQLWHGWLTGRHVDRRQDGYEKLKSITDPHAIAALTRYMADDENAQVREFYVQILARVGGMKSVRPLVAASLSDPENAVRRAARDGIPAEFHPQAAGLYVEQLQNELNVIVQRAASALGKMGDEAIVPALIDALVTHHRYKVIVPEEASPTYSFGTDGSFGTTGAVLPPNIELMLRSGQLPHGVVVHKSRPGGILQTKTVLVRREHRNSQVLAALQKITGKNLGYDERTWHLWWAAQKNGAADVPKIP